MSESHSTLAFFRRVEQEPRRVQSPHEELREERWERNAASVRDRQTNEAELTTNGEPVLPGLTDDPRTRTHYPRAGYDEPEGPIEPTIAADETLLRPEVIEYDRKMPIIAEPGTDRRHSQFDPRHVVQNERRSKPQPPVAPVEPPRESRRQATPPSPWGSTSLLGLNAPTADEVGVAGDDVSAIPGEYSPPRSMREERPHFLDMSEPLQDNRALHGPSFLGLADASEFEVADEEVRESHIRRNLALVVLAILIALAALQWRSIRDFGLKYAQNGTMNLNVPKKGEPASVQNGNAAPAAGSTDAPVASAPAANGKPEIQVQPTQNANAVNGDASSNSAAAPTQPPPPAANAKSDPPANQETQTADNSGGDLPQGEPADEETTDTPEPAPNRSAPKSSARAAEPQEGGAAELAQASSTGDPALAATWLWKAVGKGNSEASVRLADMYLDGRGVGQNCDQAMVLLKSAANKKNARARSRMGSLYATGKCVPQDRVAAYHWMTMALHADPGSEWVSHNRQMLWSQMSDGEKSQAARER